MGIVWKPSVTGTASRAGKFAVTSAGSQGLVSASGLALQQAMWAPLGSGRSSAAAAAAAAAGGAAAAAAAAGGAGVRKNPSAAQAGNTCGCKSSAWMAELIMHSQSAAGPAPCPALSVFRAGAYSIVQNTAGFI